MEERSKVSGYLVPDDIRAARKSLGWAQPTLAREARVSTDAVRNIEAGKPVWVSAARAVSSALKAAGIEFGDNSSPGVGSKLDAKPRQSKKYTSRKRAEHWAGIARTLREEKVSHKRVATRLPADVSKSSE